MGNPRKEPDANQSRPRRSLRRGTPDSGMDAQARRAHTGSIVADVVAAIPPTVVPGRAKHPGPLLYRSFVQWGAPPVQQGARMLHVVWDDGRRDGSRESCGSCGAAGPA